jgi:hypothetical protein
MDAERMNPNEPNNRRSVERDPVELSELCPTKCGCGDYCELDDQIFLSAALLDDYIRKMRADQQKKGSTEDSRQQDTE